LYGSNPLPLHTKNSVGRKLDDFKTLNYTSSAVQKLRLWCPKKALWV